MILITHNSIQISFYQVVQIINEKTPLIYPLLTYKREASHGEKEEESLCTLMLTDWPQELGKESGTSTIGPRTICKSFEFIIKWNAWACFPFQIFFFMFIHRSVNVSFTWILFIWSHSLDLSLVLFFLCRWSQGNLEDITNAPSTSTRTRTSLPYQVHHISSLSFTLNQMNMLHWIDSFTNTFGCLEY